MGTEGMTLVTIFGRLKVADDKFRRSSLLPDPGNRRLAKPRLKLLRTGRFDDETVALAYLDVA
jgi:hypothetical protein